MDELASREPRFFVHWLKANSEADPQFARWKELESRQLEEGRERVEALREHFEVNWRDVLDVGCQWGATSIALAQAGARPTGIDVDEELMAGARVRAEEQGVTATFRHGFAESLPFPDAAFDAVVCINVLEHVRSHRRTIQELTRVLRPGGHIYLNGPNRLSPQWFLSDPHYHMLGISVLPPRLGDFYVRRIRKYPAYDVGTFPIAAGIEVMLKRAGNAIVYSGQLDSGGPVAKWREVVRFNARRMFVFVARRTADPAPPDARELMTQDTSRPVRHRPPS